MRKDRLKLSRSSKKRIESTLLVNFRKGKKEFNFCFLSLVPDVTSERVCRKSIIVGSFVYIYDLKVYGLKLNLKLSSVTSVDLSVSFALSWVPRIGLQIKFVLN